MRFSVIDADGVILGAFKTYKAAERFALAFRSRDNQAVHIVDMLTRGATC
jgi:hypothetical protein